MSLFNNIQFPFFIVLGIFLLTIAFLVYYFDSKIREQNTKMSGMLSLVSSMAEEINTLKHFALTQTQTRATQQMNDITGGSGSSSRNDVHLIHVSDDEDNDDDDSDSNSDSNSESEAEEDLSESDSDNGSETCDDSDEHECVSINNDDNNIEEDNHEKESIASDFKILKINKLSNNDNDENNNHNVEDLNSQNDFSVEDMSDLESLSDDETEHKDENENNMEDVVVTQIQTENTENPADNENVVQHIDISSDLKNINIDLDIEYKKMSIGKLKSIVVEKGLINDASKMKKQELLKLLGVSE